VSTPLTIHLLPHDWLLLSNTFNPWSVAIDEPPPTVSDEVVDSALEVTADGAGRRVIQVHQTLTQRVGRGPHSVIAGH